MGNSFISSTDDGYVTQLGNLSAKAPTVQATLGLTAADITAIAADYSAMQAAVLDLASRQTAAQSSTQAKNATRAGTEKRLRALVKRIKGSNNYTPAIGELLGIVAPATVSATSMRAMASETIVQPQLKGAVSGDGKATVKFAKGNFSGVIIYSRRGDEQDFALLAKQLVSPLVDGRANLADDQPETRAYRAQYIRNDTPVGQMSDILVVTMPASTAAKPAAIATAQASALKAAA